MSDERFATCRIGLKVDVDTLEGYLQGIPSLLTQMEVAGGHTPAGRPGEPREVAHVVAFLASDEARYITGAVMEVTGGLLMT